MSDSPVMHNSQAEQHAPMDDRFPWLRHYEQKVPASIDIPDQPLTWILDTAARRFPVKHCLDLLRLRA